MRARVRRWSSSRADRMPSRCGTAPRARTRRVTGRAPIASPRARPHRPGLLRLGTLGRRPGGRPRWRRAGRRARRTTRSSCCRCPTAAPASSTCSPAPSAARRVATTVSDPLGREVPAAVLVVERDGRRTAYVEAAQASGLHLLGADERDPGLTSTWGVGQLLDAAVEQGADQGRRRASAAAAPTTPGPACSPRSGPGRRRRWRAAASPSPRPPTTRCPGSPTSSRGCAGVELVRRHRRRHPAARPAGHQRGRGAAQGRLARAGPGPRGGPGPLHRRAGPRRCPRRPSSCSAGCRAGSTARPGAGAAGGLGYGAARARRPPGRGRRRGAARRAASASPRPAATSSSPAPAGSTGARLRG